MQFVLIDGSNVSLNANGGRPLATLDCLAQVIHGLLARQIIAYTVFDASFRYRMPDDSAARQDFTYLIKEIPEYFHVAPSGQPADLFLLEMAVATAYPILSNDTYKQYGGVKDGVIRYENEAVKVCNFAVFAGTVVVRDLHIRQRTLPGECGLRGIEAKFASARASTAVLEPAIEIDDEAIQTIGAAIAGFVGSEARSLSALGAELSEYKQQFLASTGTAKGGKRSWFGSPTLSDFIRAHYPGFKIDQNLIETSEAPLDAAA